MHRILLITALAALPALADEVFLKNGGHLVGTVTDDGDPVIVKTPGGGTIKIARDKIDRIEKKPLPAVPAGDVPAAKREAKAAQSPRFVDLFNAFAIRPPAGWKKIATSKNSKCTFAAPEAQGPFKMDVWIIQSEGTREQVFETIQKAYKDAFRDYEPLWDRAATMGKLPARQFAGKFRNVGGDLLAHVHTLGGEKKTFYMIFFTGSPEKFEGIQEDVKTCLASFEVLPPLDLSPEDTKAFMDAYAKGVELFHDGKEAEAVAEFEKCAAILPKHADTHQNLAILQSKLKNQKRAIEEYTTLSNLRPDDPQPHYDLGTLLFQANRYPDAIAQFEKAIELAPDYVEAWINVGAVKSQMGEQEKAVEAFKTAIEIDPKCAPAWYNLGQVEYLRDHYREAREAWEKVLSIDAEHAGAKEGLKKLKQEGH